MLNTRKENLSASCLVKVKFSAQYTFCGGEIDESWEWIMEDEGSEYSVGYPPIYIRELNSL